MTEKPNTCGRAQSTGKPCPDHPAVPSVRAAAQRALESLDDLIANTTDPGVEALGARYELAAALSNSGPVEPRRRHRDVETDEQRTDRLATERDHAAGDHEYCGVECETEFPSDMLRNGILARAIPGSTTMLDELLRRAAMTPPAEWTEADEAKWQAAWDSRPEGADVSDLIEFVPVPAHPAPTVAGTTADKAAAAGMTPTDYRAHSHRTAVEQARTAAQGMYAETALRVLAALDGTGTEAHPAEHIWAAELHDPIADEWTPGTRYTARERAVNHLNHANTIGPTWKDGTPTQRRLVRATTTYTVEPDPAPEPEASAPAGEQPVVAYRAHMGGFLLRCLGCAPSPYLIRTGEMVPVTSDDLPDGGICTAPDCGRDVLAAI